MLIIIWLLINLTVGWFFKIIIIMHINPHAWLYSYIYFTKIYTVKYSFIHITIEFVTMTSFSFCFTRCITRAHQSKGCTVSASTATWERNRACVNIYEWPLTESVKFNHLNTTARHAFKVNELFWRLQFKYHKSFKDLTVFLKKNIKVVFICTKCLYWESHWLMYNSWSVLTKRFNKAVKEDSRQPKWFLGTVSCCLLVSIKLCFFLV